MSSSGGSHRRNRPADELVIGQFIIGGEIGKGSFAQVYIGKHKVSGAAVAVKSVELARLNKKLKENLYGEIKILKTLRHPHIVALHDCVESSTHINLVMEYCELGDLSMFIKKREKLITNPATHDMARKYPSTPNSGLNEVITRHFLKQLASALKFLREGNFVHRDVKPQNLLLLPSPQYRDAHRTTRPILTASNDSLIPVAGLPSLPMLKLADFGFARVLPSTTLAETLCGSPLYMAPEILRYERYDAKADLWSVGTVLYEMVVGRPPFRASNHVELLRKIETAEDKIHFGHNSSSVSPEMKSLIRALLKRNPVERMSFENFFAHEVVIGPIPGVVEDDVPRPGRTTPLERVAERRQSKDVSRTAPSSARTSEPAAPTTATAAVTATATTSKPTGTTSRRSSFRRYIPENATNPNAAADHDRQLSQIAAAVEAAGTEIGYQNPPSPRERTPRSESGQRMSYSPRHHDLGGRAQAQPSTSAPVSRPSQRDDRKQHRLSTASAKNAHRGQVLTEEQEKAAQDIAFERDYVLVEKKHVEVNAFADEMAANPRLAAQYQHGGSPGSGATVSPKSGQAMVRRGTQPGIPSSLPNSSRAMQMAQGTRVERHGSLSASPNSTTSFITKAIHDASFRLLGVKNPTALIGKGASPPQLYSPFPTYPTPSSAPSGPGLLTEGKYRDRESSRSPTATDGDNRVAQMIEDYATRSDVVYGFAEVKYKQLVPLAPSAQHDLSGLPVSDKATPTEDEDELTIDAVVVLSEEALVLYVKALSLLAKSMDVASVWWKSKMRADASGGANQLAIVRESAIGLRVNAAVQWVRARFNEVLEKANFARLRLVEAQKRLPDDHPSNPNNNNREDANNTGATGGSSTADGVFLSAGVSAEKLMYDRAVEMSRAAAIGEISNEDLAGCELSYVTAICMLEAVLDTDDEVVAPKRKLSGSKEEKSLKDEDSSDINVEDQKTVEFMISMIKARLAAVRKKARLISSHSRAQQQQQQQSLVRRRSGDVTPRSVPSHAS